VPKFESFDGVALAYEISGDGVPVVLLHGYAADAFVTWVRPGVVDALAREGYRAIVLDQRGHGDSDKPHDAESYADGAMVRDAQALLDHLGLDACLGVGYSMGARNILQLLTQDARIRAAVLGGIGSNMLHDRGFGDAIADAMVAEDKSTVTDRFARSFRDFADLTRADRQALAAIMRNSRMAVADPSAVNVPVLVLCGDNDPMVGDPQELADAIPGAKAAVVGGTHLNVVNNPEFHRELIEFLNANRSEVGGGA
jgi:pimeloyl-ACP methyl ester carboxylesterase